MSRDRARPRMCGGRVAVFASCVLVALVFASRPAHAQGKLIDLHGSILAGGMVGGGSSGGGTPDFFHQTAGPGFGAELGLRLLVLDLTVRFVQMAGSNGAQGTLSSLMLGPLVEIPVVPGGEDARGRRRPPRVVVRPGFAAGLGFGTPAPVNPPLSNDQISAKGLLVIGRFGIERMFGPVLGLGGEIEGGYHYLVGATGVVNGNDHSSGWQLAGFGTLSFHLGV